jgi:DNA polymerase-3 subunit alpha
MVITEDTCEAPIKSEVLKSEKTPQEIGRNNPLKERIFLRHHIHSVHSTRDGMLKIKDLVAEAKADGEVFSLTDHGSIGGWIECIDECEKAGIKPIVGVEAYMNDHRAELIALRGSKDKSKTDERDKIKQNFHLVLLAKNNHGFTNIITLCNSAVIDGFYGKPLVTYDELRALPDDEAGSKGIIVTSACLGGTLPQLLMADELKLADDWCRMMMNAFGDDFYLEVHSNNIDLQKDVNSKILQLSKKIGCKVCIGMDSHYLKQDWSDTHQDLLLLQTKKSRNDLGMVDYRLTIENAKGEVKTKKVLEGTEFKRMPVEAIKVGDTFGKNKSKETVINIEQVERTWKFASNNAWYKNEAELRHEVEMFHDELKDDIEDIIDTNYDIYDKIESVKLDRSLKLPISNDSDKTLMHLILKKMEEKGVVSQEAVERVKHEFRVIRENNFCDYFLILADLLDYARSMNIPLGAGRGSAAGCYIAYLLDIHRINSLDPKYGDMPFERFLSDDRNLRTVTTTDSNGVSFSFKETDIVKVCRAGNILSIPAIKLAENDALIIE